MWWHSVSSSFVIFVLFAPVLYSSREPCVVLKGCTCTEVDPSNLFDWCTANVSALLKHASTLHGVSFHMVYGGEGKFGENPFYWKQQGFVVKKGLCKSLQMIIRIVEAIYKIFERLFLHTLKSNWRKNIQSITD